jgi:hypothetical protein
MTYEDNIIDRIKASAKAGKPVRYSEFSDKCPVVHFLRSINNNHIAIIMISDDGTEHVTQIPLSELDQITTVLEEGESVTYWWDPGEKN